MMITDYWANPITPAPVQVIGFRGLSSVFPHDLYSYLLSTIREADQNGTALIYRWLQPMQQMWESQYGLIGDIPKLISPELCPTALLDHLRKNVGLMDDLGYLWGCASESEKRRLIKYFIRFLKYRATGFGLDEMLETMTGLRTIIRGYFYYRWLLSGDTAYDMATALGREDEGNDPWLLSEADMATGVIPDAVTASVVGGVVHYQFTLDSLVAALADPPVPEYVYVKLIGTGSSQYMPIYFNGTHWLADAEPDFAFGQSELSLTTKVSNFRAGFESDEFVFDVMIEESASLNKELVRGLVQFSRPQSERAYVRYYKLIEEFTDVYRWTAISGTTVWSETNRTITLGNVGADTRYRLTLADAVDWTSYCVHVKMRHLVNEKWSKIVFMYVSDTDYYYLKLTPATPPSIPAGTWEIGLMLGGTEYPYATGDLEWLDAGVDYTWRIECFTSDQSYFNQYHVLITDRMQVFRLYQDENLLTTYNDGPLPGDLNVKGTIELATETGGSLVVSEVLVNSVPMESDFVGP